jgi:hypothetical protein
MFGWLKQRFVDWVDRYHKHKTETLQLLRERDELLREIALLREESRIKGIYLSMAESSEAFAEEQSTASISAPKMPEVTDPRPPKPP